MHTVYLLLGSNLGNSISVLKDACQKIDSGLGKVSLQSSFYKSPPWGFDHENDFVNQVLELKTSFSPHDLLEGCLSIEKLLGRERNESNGYVARIIDIDILLFDNEVLHTEELQIPHPRMHLRRFTLLPLVEVCDTIIYPVYNKTVGQLLFECKASFSVQLMPSS